MVARSSKRSKTPNWSMLCGNAMGSNLQAVVMVRDDFAMAAARFMDALDIPILQGHNFATVDLFDVDHAEKVLINFGQAFGKLPAQTGKLSDEEKAFVSCRGGGFGSRWQSRLRAVGSVCRNGQRQTLDSRTHWKKSAEPKASASIFWKKPFAARTANPKHRQHQAAAREVLKCLLPEVGSDIKGHMRSHAELLEASGYKNRPKEFEELLRILDGELRLITPTDPAGFESDSDSDPNTKYYQLTHDYLGSLLARMADPQTDGKPKKAGPNCGWRNARPCGMPNRRIGICPRCGNGSGFAR